MTEEKNSKDQNITDSDETEEKEKTGYEDPDVSFGIGRWRTRNLKHAHYLLLFSVFGGLIGMFSNMVALTLVGQVGSFEKHYNFEPLSAAGSLMSMENVGKLMIIFGTGYIANYMPIPKLTAVLGIMYGIFMTIPLYLNKADPYQFPGAETTTTSAPSVTVTPPPPGEANGFTCNLEPNTTLPGPPVYDGKEIYKMLVGNVMFGFGLLSAVQWGPMVFVFLDNNIVDKTKLGIYLAVSVCITELSKPFGYLFNEHLNKLQVDLGDPVVSPDNPTFVTAWWLGPTVFGFLTAAVSIPLLFLPNDLMSGAQQYEQVKRASASAVHPDMKADTKFDDDEIAYVTRGHGMSNWQKSKVFFRGFPRIFKNSSFITLFFVGGIILMPALGLKVFNLPYNMFEYNVGLPEAQKASAFTEYVANSLAAVVSALVCCYITRKRHYLQFITCCVFLCSVLIPISFYLGCDDVQIYGVNAPDFGSNVTLQAVACPCDNAPGMPTCGADGNNYRNPCHAGCTMAAKNGEYLGCKNLEMGDTAEPYLCPGGCDDQLFLNSNVLYTITTFLYRLTDIPKYLLALRIIAPKDRGIALAALDLSKIAGTFLAPLLMMGFFNDNCLVWLNKQICLYYDRRNMRLLKTGVEFHTYIFAFVLWFVLSKLNRLTDRKLREGAGSDSKKSPGPVEMVEVVSSNSHF